MNDSKVCDPRASIANVSVAIDQLEKVFTHTVGKVPVSTITRPTISFSPLVCCWKDTTTAEGPIQVV